MTVLPITTGNYFAPVQPGGAQVAPGSGTAAFSDYFKDALGNLESLEAQKQYDSYLLSVGEVDDIAQIELTAQKAQTMMTLLVQLRNSLVDSYNEIMRMNI